MGVTMMRWRPWPPLLSRKFDVKLVVKRIEGFNPVGANAGGFTVEIRWKGPKVSLTSFRRTVKRNCTGEGVGVNGVIEWEEEFGNACSLSGYKDDVFHPWEICFTLFNSLSVGTKNKVTAVGTATVNLAEYISEAEEKEFDVSIPLVVSGTTTEPRPSLCISLSLLELKTPQEPTDSVQKPVVSTPSPLRSGETSSSEKEELSALKAGLRKVKIFTEFVSARRSKKPCREQESSSDDYTNPFDSDSFSDFEGESDEYKDDPTVRKSFSYGKLAYANTRNKSDYEDWVYYSNRKSDVGCSHVEDTAASTSEPPVLVNSRRSILPWRKRKLSFRSPKAKGEPLLKKAYAEEGGDDIDFDRRQLSSDESPSFGWQKTEEDSSANRSSVSDFGDDSFVIGSWDQKEIISRDGYLKLKSQVFFASIDQRSERAGGESACTALVAVIADWFQNNKDLMPIKSQFDTLIRDGSLEWRKLCENPTYRDKFLDKHFDLETVLQAEIRPLSVLPDKSFIGFFHPDGMEGSLDFLQFAMSFDAMWEEITRARSQCSDDTPHVYIISWNDHFFLLKVESEAYYIIDTLGERLYEGCNHAYILKFDQNTLIHKLAGPTQTDEQKPQEGEMVICRGKESCKEYIKNFLASIPIRELQADIKKGLMASTPIHQRLQIEFHYTKLQQLAAPTITDDAEN